MRKVWLSLCVLVVLVYTVFFFSLQRLPALDLPNHTARQAIIASLLFEEHSPFASRYSIDLQPRPYILGDLLGALLIRWVGIATSAAIMYTLAFLAIPLGAWIYLRCLGRSWIDFMLAVPFVIYLATSRFLFLGYNSFSLSMGIGLALLGAWEKCSRPDVPHSWIWRIIYALGAFTLFLTHSYGLALFTVCCGVKWLWQLRQNWGQAMRTAWMPLLPPLFVLAMKVADPGTLDTFWTYFAPRSELLDRFFDPFFRFDKTLDLWLAHLHLGCFLLLVVMSPRAVRSHEKTQQLSLALIFFTLFLVLPVGLMKAWDVDVRVLVYGFFFLVLALIPHASPEFFRQRRLILVIPAFVMLANLIFIVQKVGSADRGLADFYEAMDLLPPGKNVLMVDAAGQRYDPRIHQINLYVAKQFGNTPALFTYEGGAPFGYFHIDPAQKLSEPSSKWYLQGDFADFEKHLDQYDYIIASQELHLPANLSSRLQEVVKKSEAALYRVVK